MGSANLCPSLGLVTSVAGQVGQYFNKISNTITRKASEQQQRKECFSLRKRTFIQQSNRNPPCQPYNMPS